MASWRDSASEQAQADVDALVEASLPFAQQMLDEHGALLPYGVALSDQGQIRMVAADVGQQARPSNVELVALLVEGLRRDRAAIRAYALVFQVRLAASHAVRLELEHREGHALAMLLPYEKKRLRRIITYGHLVTTTGDHHLWPP
jgi:hypothetical protein